MNSDLIVIKSEIMDLTKFTIKQLREICQHLGYKPGSNFNKKELIQYTYGAIIEKNNGINRQEQIISSLTITPKWYQDDQNQWLEHLITKGWSIVPIPDFDTSKYVNDFWNFLESCHPLFKRNDPKTWTNDKIPILLHGIFKQYIGHTKWIWEIREKCIPIFEQIWGTKDLLCSFDGACFLKPTTKDKLSKMKQWIHCDQGRFNMEFCCIQGLVNLLDNGPNDGGLVLVEDSQKYFTDYLERHPTDGIKWFKVNMNDPNISQLPIIKLCAPAGHMILWDSRVFHCNIQPTGDTPRMCTYVSMGPRNGATTEELVNRINWYEKGSMSSHWVYGPWMTENAKDPHSYGGQNNHPDELEIAVLNPVQRRLVGYDQ